MVFAIASLPKKDKGTYDDKQSERESGEVCAEPVAYRDDAGGHGMEYFALEEFLHCGDDKEEQSEGDREAKAEEKGGIGNGRGYLFFQLVLPLDELGELDEDFGEVAGMLGNVDQ
jgi:hypothetical protein